MKSALEQCRDALREILAYAGSPERVYQTGKAALAAAEAALAAQPEPIAWAQLGMRNGHTYVRMNYEGHLYPPSADVQRNLNLTPLYAAPVAQPLTDEQITDIVREAAKGSAIRRDGSTSHRIARAIERAHGIAPKEPA